MLAGCGVFGTDPPSPPGEIQLSPSQGGVNVSWSGSSKANGYNVYRSDSSISDGVSGLTPINSDTPVSDTKYSDENAENSTEYYYRVSAVNEGGESGPSPEASVQMPYPEPPENPE